MLLLWKYTASHPSPIMVLYNCVNHRGGIFSALFIVHAQCHVPRRWQESFCWMNTWMGGHSVKRTSPSSALCWSIHLKEGLSLCMCLWKTIFWCPTLHQVGASALSSSLPLCAVAKVSHLPHFFGWMGMRVPRLWERWVRKRSHSGSNSVRATVSPFGWTFSLSLYTLRC